MAKKKEVLPRVVFGLVVESVNEVKGVALKIKHSPGPNASYGKDILEQHFVWCHGNARRNSGTRSTRYWVECRRDS